MGSISSGQIAASTCHGTLTLGGTSMNTKAWASLNNYVLWASAPRRGDNLAIPGVSGRTPMPRRRDQSQRTLECLIIGDCTSAGVAYGDASVGLATNWGILESSIMNWGGTGITATLVRPNGVSRSGLVQITNVEIGETGTSGALVFSIDLTLPYGELS